MRRHGAIACRCNSTDDALTCEAEHLLKCSHASADWDADFANLTRKGRKCISRGVCFEYFDRRLLTRQLKRDYRYNLGDVNGHEMFHLRASPALFGYSYLASTDAFLAAFYG